LADFAKEMKQLDFWRKNTENKCNTVQASHFKVSASPPLIAKCVDTFRARLIPHPFIARIVFSVGLIRKSPLLVHLIFFPEIQ